MKSYLQLLRDIQENGNLREDRTGTGTTSIFGYQWRHNLCAGFPLLTTKKVHWKSIVHELLWFLSGSTNIKYLQDHGVTIWNEWADADGEVGRVYGAQWREWKLPGGGQADQIAELIQGLKKQPFSRRHVVTAWNPADVPFCKLPPCHFAFQCYVKEVNPDGASLKQLSMHVNLRSCDAFLGLPFNIASYALLLEILCKIVGYYHGELIVSFGDLHIYSNHENQVYEQVMRKPGILPRVEFTRDLFGVNINSVDFADISLIDYEPQAAIPAPVAV